MQSIFSSVTACRTITALCLHGDDAHVVSNIAFLWLFSSLVSVHLGFGFTWLLILISGAGGNLLNAYFYGTAHNSIGASTSVFGALGLLVAFKISFSHRKEESLKRKLIPFGSMLALLAMLGTGKDSDVLAHLFGLIFGFGLGLLWKAFPQTWIEQSKTFQYISILVFISLIIGAWMLSE